MDQVFPTDDQTVLFEAEGTPTEEDDVFLEEDTDIDSMTTASFSSLRRCCALAQERALMPGWPGP